MKEKVHPKYFKTTATCACGATYQIGSTKENIRVDICSKCHPLFTGTMKLLDTEGRVEKFKKKYERAAEREKAKKETQEKRKTEKEQKIGAKKEEKPSVIEKLEEIRKGKKNEAPAKPAPKHEKPKAAKKPEKKPAKKSK